MMGVQGYVPASYLSKVDLSPQELVSFYFVLF